MIQNIVRYVVMPVIVIAAIACVIWDWKVVLGTLVLGIVAAVVIPSVLFTPIFLWYLIDERSLQTAWSRSCTRWKNIFETIIDAL